MANRTIRIANAGGYWGDDPEAIGRALGVEGVDYIVSDYLSEITLVIMERARRRDPKGGYALDFVPQFRRCLKELKEKKVRLIVNAGGVNPQGCRDAIVQVCAEMGVAMKVATISGDNIMERLSEFRHCGVSLDHLDTGRPFSEIADRVLSAHAYLGAQPIAHALRQGAEIVITGRVTDAALTLGPLIAEFGWRLDDWDRLGAGMVAGHLLECSAQATGGNYTDWQELGTLVGMGYPLVDVEESGAFIVTKPPGSNGVVNRKTVIEQLLYEIGDPRQYLSPDVTTDFTTIELTETGPNQVRISGIKGSPPPSTLKVGLVYPEGFRAIGTVLLSGPEVLKKGRALAELIWNSVGESFQEQRTDFLGYSACWGQAAPAVEPNEILLRLAVRDEDRMKVEHFSTRLLTCLLKGPPGLGVYGGRPSVEEALAFWPALVPASAVPAQIEISSTGGVTEVIAFPSQSVATVELRKRAEEPRAEAVARTEGGATCRVRLREVAYGRSGDKGDLCNIGIAARSPRIFENLRRLLTPAKVKAYFGDVILGEVERYELPNLLAFNFICHQALGGGGTRSLRVDHQGKTMAQGLLNMEIEIDAPAFATVSKEKR